MKKNALYPKVAADLFLAQLKWSAWFLGIHAAIHIVVLYFNLGNEAEIAGFFTFSRYSAAIFMLVCGIMAFSFMAHYVQQGTSRKDTYLGIALAAVRLSLVITLIPLLVNGIEYALTAFTSLPLNFDHPFLSDTGLGWFWTIASYFVNVFTYYLVGWMIGVGYYRYGWLIGFLFLALGAVTFSFNDYFQGDKSITTILPWLPEITAEAAPITSLTGSAILIALLLVFLRLLTKKIAIKM